MATRISARIAAANARLRTGSAEATRRSDRIAARTTTTRIQSSTARITKKPKNQPSHTKATSAARVASAAERGEQRIQTASERTPAAGVSSDTVEHSRPLYSGGPTLGRDYLPGPFSFHSRYLVQPSSEGEDDDNDDERYSDEESDGLNEDPGPPPYDGHEEERFLQVLFDGVTTQRALR